MWGFQDPVKSFLKQIPAFVEQGLGRKEMWSSFINETRSRRIAEVGVWKGEFARQMLSDCSSIETYFLLDPWRKLEAWNKPWNIPDSEFRLVFADARRNVAPFRSKAVILRGTTIEVIHRIPDESLDFAYIDGDHTLRGITIDLLSIFQKIKADCFVAGDDFCETIWQHSREFEPSLVSPFAVYFAEAVGRRDIYSTIQSVSYPEASGPGRIPDARPHKNI